MRLRSQFVAALLATLSGRFFLASQSGINREKQAPERGAVLLVFQMVVPPFSVPDVRLVMLTSITA